MPARRFNRIFPASPTRKVLDFPSVAWKVICPDSGTPLADVTTIGGKNRKDADIRPGDDVFPTIDIENKMISPRAATATTMTPSRPRTNSGTRQYYPVARKTRFHAEIRHSDCARRPTDLNPHCLAQAPVPLGCRPVALGRQLEQQFLAWGNERSGKLWIGIHPEIQMPGHNSTIRRFVSCFSPFYLKQLFNS